MDALNGEDASSITEEFMQNPMLFASFLGDTNTIKILSLSGGWHQETLDMALAQAAMLGHTETAATLLIAGAGNLERAASFAIMQNHTSLLDLVLRHEPDAATVHPTIWAIHMDHVSALEVVGEYRPSIAFNSRMLGTAITSEAAVCRELILKRMKERPAAFVLSLALDKAPALLPRLVEKGGTLLQADMTRLRDKHPRIYAETLKLLVRRRWRQVRAVVALSRFWQNWVLDYYSPGNEQYPEGKGFKRAFERFSLNLDLAYEDEEQ